MFVIQRAFLNSPGLLCGLHDCLETGSNPTYKEIKLALERTLCLLGSANTQVTILKRQRILPSINRSRNNLAELPLTSAKTWLFGAAKQAELSRGLTKNLAHQASKPFPNRTTSSLSKGEYWGENISKFQSSGGYSTPSRSQSNFHGSHSKNGNFRPSKGRQPESQNA